MKQLFLAATISMLLAPSLTACSKNPDSASGNPGDPKSGTISGKIVDNNGHSLSGVKVTAEHTVWYDKYVFATTNSNGQYSIDIPGDPAGSWTAKSQLVRSAYGQTYKFDLAPQSTEAFNVKTATVRNFTWKLSGPRSGTSSLYGAHADIYAFGTDVQPDAIKLLFTPLENTLIDGSPATVIERGVEDVAGTFMAKDIPIGRYKVKAVYAGKTLLLDNRHDNGNPAEEKEVVFGKAGILAETEYNIEFWLSE